nr:reverse transcriptase zinc-binding domain-containing protein [Tanacetum cinerariifolium]
MDKKELSETWDTFVEHYISSVCNNSIGSILMRTMLPSVVYHIWKERNTRLYTGDEIDDKTLLKIIIENVKLQLMCLKVKKSPNVVNIALNWNVEMNFKVSCSWEDVRLNCVVNCD